MFYVYRFLDNEKNIIYVGKSKQSLEQRFKGHTHLPDACYNLTYEIEYIECKTESDMSIKEIYYINKYRHDGVFFNVLDTTEVPISVGFDDTWKQYIGPLGPHFHNSINYQNGYTIKKEIRYNRDGSVCRRRSNSEPGVSVYVDALTKDEVNLMIEHLITEINNAENNNQEQIRFRNLLMFVLAINIPHKLNEFIGIKYKDVFDEYDNPKPIVLDLGRLHKDRIIEIPLKAVVKDTLLAYIHYLGWRYETNADNMLFESRQHQIVASRSCWRIIKNTASAVGIKKNIGVESLRKTYGYNIYSQAEDKLNAILFLGEIWGQVRDATIIRYLNLTGGEVDFDYYLGETFSIGDVDFSKINCLQPCERESSSNILGKKEPEKKNISSKSAHESEKSIDSVPSKPKEKNNKRKWTREELEIIEKHLKQNIPVEILAEEYKLHQSIIKFWIYNYKQEEVADQDTIKQTNTISSQGLPIIEDQKKKELVAWFVDTLPKVPRTNKVWTKEIKLEIVNKNILQYIPQIVLAKEYDVPAGNISQWVKAYKKYGESAFDDKRRKNK